MITPAQAIEAFPLLARLLALGAGPAAWQFTLAVDANGDHQAVLGVRVWPDGHADSLGILGEDDTQVVRVNPNGECVWKSTDTLACVLDELAVLPDPGTNNAPRLVIAGSVNELHFL